MCFLQRVFKRLVAKFRPTQHNKKTDDKFLPAVSHTPPHSLPKPIDITENYSSLVNNSNASTPISSTLPTTPLAPSTTTLSTAPTSAPSTPPTIRYSVSAARISSPPRCRHRKSRSYDDFYLPPTPAMLSLDHKESLEWASEYHTGCPFDETDIVTIPEEPKWAERRRLYGGNDSEIDTGNITPYTGEHLWRDLSTIPGWE